MQHIYTHVYVYIYIIYFYIYIHRIAIMKLGKCWCVQCVYIHLGCLDSQIHDATLMRSLPAGLKHQLSKWVKGSAAMLPAIVFFTPCCWVIVRYTGCNSSNPRNVDFHDPRKKQQRCCFCIGSTLSMLSRRSCWAPRSTG